MFELYRPQIKDVVYRKAAHVSGHLAPGGPAWPRRMDHKASRGACQPQPVCDSVTAVPLTLEHFTDLC